MKARSELIVQTLLIAVAVVATQFLSCSKESDSFKNESLTVSDNSTEKTLTANLVARYTFNGDVKDHSGHHNDVTFNNATPTAGKKGISNTAYLFDGSTSYMTVPNSSSLNPSAGITLVALFKVNGFYPGQCHANRIFMKGYRDQSDGIYFLGYDDGAYYNYQGCDLVVQSQFENFYGTYGNNQFNSAGARAGSYVQTNKWYTLMYTYDGSLSKLYINGVLKTTTQQTASFTSNTDNLYIGRMEYPLFPYWFNGVIDEIRIYDAAATDLQAQTISQSLQE